MAATRFSTTTITACALFGSLGALVSWTSWERKAENTSRTRQGALSCSAKAWQGCSQEQPISQHLGILALQTSTPKRFKGHPRSSRSWVGVWRLYSWTEGLNMVIVNLCPFVALIPDLFPAPPLLGLGMHQISWLFCNSSVSFCSEVDLESVPRRERRRKYNCVGFCVLVAAALCCLIPRHMGWMGYILNKYPTSIHPAQKSVLYPNSSSTLSIMDLWTRRQRSSASSLCKLNPYPCIVYPW